MSGTAGLSAAKNRRSGNEVKFTGQPKPFIPSPQQCSQKGCGGQKPMPPQPQMQMQPQMQPPHPLVVLKSHELRLQKIESSENQNTFDTLFKDLEQHKEDYSSFKQDYTALKSSLNLNTKKTSDTDIVTLQRRVDEMQKHIMFLLSEQAKSKVTPNIELKVLDTHETTPL